ncbi:MAG: FAD-dependent thymidylate synthase [Deltaproteobacteria bacterium]|nr:FAD-dependent thymidylate synthase [Deltaproteobacteria bacterium]
MSEAVDELEGLLAAPPQLTRRPVVQALEERLYRPVRVLDHGFVRVVDYSGDDGAVVQAARVSYGGGTRSVSSDRGLIRYLMRHRHTTPFEMCELKLHVKLPIFVARQWIRHRTASVNEISGRYSVLDREFYLPPAALIATQASSNRQGRGASLDADEAGEVLRLLREDAMRSFGTYQALLNDDGSGEAADPTKPMVARELARINLGLSTYTQWYWKTDLHNLLHFLALRLDRHAQVEIRRYAQVIADVVAAWVPHTWEAFLDYRMGAHTFSREELALIRGALRGQDLEEGMERSGLSGRERAELLSVLGLR